MEYIIIWCLNWRITRCVTTCALSVGVLIGQFRIGWFMCVAVMCWYCWGIICLDWCVMASIGELVFRNCYWHYFLRVASITDISRLFTNVMTLPPLFYAKVLLKITEHYTSNFRNTSFGFWELKLQNCKSQTPIGARMFQNVQVSRFSYFQEKICFKMTLYFCLYFLKCFYIK